MEHEEILQLVNSLRINDEFDGEVVSLEGDVGYITEKKLQSCLVCKVVSPKAMPIELFRA